MVENENSLPADALALDLVSTQQWAAQIQSLVESARGHAASADDLQRQCSATVGSVQEKVSEILSVASQAVAARTQIADEQTVIAQKSAHIQSAQEHADGVRASLDRILTAVTQQSTEAEGSKTRAQSASDSAAELLLAVKTAKAAVETDAMAVVTARDTANELVSRLRVLADAADSVQQRIAAYETALGGIKQQSEAQLETIVGLLPGATSAGLAHAFDQRRQTFLKPRVRWQWVFVAALVVLVMVGSTGLWQAYGAGTALTYDHLARIWLARLPIAGALIWLALHASRESALAKRLEEDYGYKAAVAASFQGFHKQMAEMGQLSAGASDGPLSKLCADTLATIAAPPGRIYEGHKLTVTPTAELTKVVADAVQSIKQ
jgi:hypothetical protein